MIMQLIQGKYINEYNDKMNRKNIML